MRVRAFASWGSLLALTACSADQTTLQFIQGALPGSGGTLPANTEPQPEEALSQPSPQPEATVNRPSLAQSSPLQTASARRNRAGTSPQPKRQPADLLTERLEQIRAQRAQLSPAARPGRIVTSPSPVQSATPSAPASQQASTRPSSPPPKLPTAGANQIPSSSPFSVTPVSALPAPRPTAPFRPTEATNPRAENGSGVPLSDTETVGYAARDLLSPTLAASSLPPDDHGIRQPSRNLHASRSPDVTLAPARTASSGFHHGQAPAVNDLNNREGSTPQAGNATSLEATSGGITEAPTPDAADFAAVAEQPVPVTVDAAPTIADGATEDAAPRDGENTAPNAPDPVEAADDHSRVDPSLPTKHNLAQKTPAVQLTPGGNDPQPIFSASSLNANGNTQATREPSPSQTSSLQGAVVQPPQGSSASRSPVAAGAAEAQSAALPASLPLHDSRENQVATSAAERVALSPQPASLETALATSTFANGGQLPSQHIGADGWEHMSFSNTLRLNPDRQGFSPPPFSPDTADSSDAVLLQQGNQI